jgi:hypothetical protein
MPINWNRPQPAPQAVWHLVNANFPVTGFGGIYSPRNVRGRNIPSLHAEGRALDIMLKATDPAQKMVADGLFRIFVDLAQQIGLEEVIWNRQVWSQRNHLGVHPDTGADPHTGHIHVGFTRDGSQKTSFALLELKVAVLRTGLDDLRKASGRLA